ncbi:MAG TPA: VOC family protein [Anaerolineales bacterium]|nr:VOC family protein [Anaerolineales bacterium]
MLTNAFAMASLPAEDVKRAIKFYTETLGIKKVAEPFEGSVIFEAGRGSQFFMYQRARTKAEHTVLNFMVENVEEAVKALTAKGVKFEQYDFPGVKTNDLGIAEVEGQKAAWFTDPEGNIIAIEEEQPN